MSYDPCITFVDMDVLAEMKAAAGYLRNAKIDLKTGTTKATAIRTIEGGLKRLEAAISQFEGASSPCTREQTMQSLASESQAMGLYGDKTSSETP
ncbi:hypothetical protein [Mesorhizobium sp. Root172]|uniref:hypothetical protein n=1 Tax=Mesorhizobium sp. Root172 TaxID=1736481 RepID=UPI0007009C66|nr:hypothetical protein [Mesorhizobium sp. Root172]KRB22691.1 hypothetical protein ASE05_16030 [Mesorhizobium sp. Root172]